MPMSAAQGHGSGLPVGGAAGLCSCSLAPQPVTLPWLQCSFPPLCLSFHCLLYLPLNAHLPSLTADPATGTSPQGLEPFPPSKRNLPVALSQASRCSKCFSQVWDSLLSFLFTLLT